MGELVRMTLQQVCISLKHVARGVGVSQDTVKGWSMGRTDPSPENRAALVAFLRAHSEKVAGLADDLEESGSP